jgi:hypothetical protein
LRVHLDLGVSIGEGCARTRFVRLPQFDQFR